jgi:hypothetical protein
VLSAVINFSACLRRQVVNLVCGYIHTYSHKPNKQLDDGNNQRSSNSTKNERRPPEDSQTIVNEIFRVLIMYFTNIFKNLEY